MTPEDKLTALLAAGAPPARDTAFCAVVAARIARRRAWATVGAGTPWAVAGTAMLWSLQPVLGPITTDMGDALGPSAAMLGGAALTVVSALWMARRFHRG